MAERDSGWMQLYCENVQDVYDLTMCAYRIAEDRRVQLPCMVCLDGFFLSHSMQKVRVAEQAEADAFIGPYRRHNSYIDPEDPMIVNNLTSSDEFTEMRYQQSRGFAAAAEVMEEVFTEFQERFGREHHVVEPYRLEDAKTVLVTIGSMAGTAKYVADRLREQGQHVGVLKIVSFRPFPYRQVAALLKNAEHAAVLDRSAGLGAQGAPVWLDVTEYKFEAVRADASIEVFFAEKEAVQADKTKLNESIAAAEELLKHAEDYVPEDVQNLMEVLDAAKAVAADPAATQETVDAAQNALDAAMNIAPIQKEFAIMAAAGEGGSITPCGTVKVERGMSQTFVIQPEEGYVISDVLVNGQSVGAVAEYTFCDVNADANITALFQKAAVSTDKSQLTAVIKEAEERLEQADKYTEETVKALQKEVEAAQFILADKEASQADIDAAVQKVRTAIDALEEKAQTEKPENPDNNKPDNKPDNKPGNGNNGGQNNNGNNNQSSTQKPSAGTPNKAVKTGDATPIAGAVSGLLAGGAALLAFLKRRR